MEVLEPGHAYQLRHLEGEDVETLRFLRRSSKAVNYKEGEHPGTNTQEVLRALIERTKYLNWVIPCEETGDAIYFLRMALYSYESRAYRRKLASLNKEAGGHESIEPGATRDHFYDVPFTEHEIELLPVGDDGHIIWKEST